MRVSRHHHGNLGNLMQNGVHFLAVVDVPQDHDEIGAVA